MQALRNRTAVALQLGAGLTPGDIRAATVDGVVCQDTSGASRAGLPWKVRLPTHGSAQAREAPLAPWGKVAQYSAAKAVLAAAGAPDGDGGSFKLRHTFALRQLRRGGMTLQHDTAAGTAPTLRAPPAARCARCPAM